MPKTWQAARPALEPIMIELNLRYQPGVAEAVQQVRFLWRLVGAAGEPIELADQYLVGELSTSQLEGIVSADAAAGDWPQRAIYRIWPDFEAHPQIDVSGTTIKARAAQRTFESLGDGIVWAVVDSGVQADHPHFLGYETLKHESVKDLHRDFTVDSDDPGLALVDDDGHGTHVAGIIAGGLEKWDSPTRKVIATEKRFNVASADEGLPHRPASRGSRHQPPGRDGPAREAGQPKGARRRRRPQRTGEQGDACSGVRAREECRQ